MYKTCPKCGHERTAEDKGEPGRCPACGLIYRKWLKQRFRRQEQAVTGSNKRRFNATELLHEISSYSTPQSRPLLYARAAMWLLLIIWGFQFILMDHRILDGGLPDINRSFLHGVNLVFHEAGHILFIPLGDFMSVLGGSLMQLIMPLTAAIALSRHGDPFGASAGLWWLGQSLMDLAPYIHDAGHGRMLLLGGVTGQDRPGYHDWTNILGRLDMLGSGHGLATFTDAIGVVLMLLALAWGGLILKKARN